MVCLRSFCLLPAIVGCGCFAELAVGQVFYSPPYYYTSDGSGATITQTGSLLSGDVTIPATLGGLPVKAISERAFYGRPFTSLSLPASVATLNGRAFDGCNNLQWISVSSSNSNFSATGGVLFDKSRTKIVRRPAGMTGNYQFPSSVTTIGTSAFDGNHLTSITVPDKVTWIESSAFMNCRSLETVILPANLERLDFLFLRRRGGLHRADMDGLPLDRYGCADGSERVARRTRTPA